MSITEEQIRRNRRRIGEVKQIHGIAAQVFGRVAALLREAKEEMNRLPEHPYLGDYSWDSYGETTRRSIVGDLRRELFDAERDASTLHAIHGKNAHKTYLGNSAVALAAYRRVKNKPDPYTRKSTRKRAI